jgi:hypothetical protein
MLHISELDEHAHRFHKDKDGNVPEHGDDWRNMKFDHGANDPDEAGISDEERQLRLAYLDDQWWPKVIAQVNQEKEALSQLPGGSPIKKWRDEAMQEPPTAHGFIVE